MKYIAVDFDGTCVAHAYPKVGKDIGAGIVLRLLQDEGYKIILNTMRDKDELKDAEDWFDEQGIDLYGSNVNPSQKSWTTSPKVHADVFIDDRNICAPLYEDGDGLYIDWCTILKECVRQGWLYLSRQEISSALENIKRERSSL